MISKVFLFAIFAVINVMCDKPTVTPSKTFDPEKDAKQLKAAIDFSSFGIPGTDENDIIDVIAFRSRQQRNKITATYQKLFNTSLIHELFDDTSGDLKHAIKALMTPRAHFYARELYILTKKTSIKSSESFYDFDSIMEILLSLSKNSLVNTARVYQELYKRNLQEIIISLTPSRVYKKIIQSIFQGVRSRLAIVNPLTVASDADALAWTQKKWWNSESFFQWLFLRENYVNLAAVLNTYEASTGRNIEEDIRHGFGQIDAKCYIAITRYARDKMDYFARRLYEAMDGSGTNEDTLTRIIVGRSEIDLGDIKKAYKKKYGENLADHIEEETWGKYSKLLLSVIRLCNQ